MIVFKTAVNKRCKKSDNDLTSIDVNSNEVIEIIGTSTNKMGQKNLVSPLVWRDKLYNSLAVEEPAAMSDLITESKSNL